MAYRGVGASIKTKGGTKYTIESDGIIDVTTKVGEKVTEYKEVRLVGTNRMGDCIRCIMPKTKTKDGTTLPGGVTEIPIKLITKVIDSPGKNNYPAVKTE